MDEKFEFDAELWIPKTQLEKRRTLSGVVSRSLANRKKILVLSCDDWVSFFARLGMSRDLLDDALTHGLLDFIQVSSSAEGRVAAGRGTDLSRVLGEIGAVYQRQPIDRVIVDSVEQMIDLGTPESTLASMYALLYALQGRFHEIVLVTTPPLTDRESDYLLQMEGSMRVHKTGRETEAPPVSQPEKESVAA